MCHHRIAKAGTRSRTEVDHAVRHARLFQKLDEFCGDSGRVAGWLQDDRVARDDRSQRHARHDGRRKIPRRNHRADAQWNVKQAIALPGRLHWQFRFREAQRLAAVVLAEIDGFGDVAISFRPVLADFENHPRGKLKLALAQQVADAEQQASALLDRSAAPSLKCPERGVHRGLNVFLPCFLVESDNLRGFRRIQRPDLIRGLDALSTNDQVIFAPQLGAHFLNRSAHLAGIFWVAEINQRLVRERPFMQADLRASGGFNRCHRCTSRRYLELWEAAIEQLIVASGNTPKLSPMAVEALSLKTRLCVFPGPQNP